MSSWIHGNFTPDGVWHRCTNVYPQCMGRAATDECTCPIKPDDQDAWPPGYGATAGRGHYAGRDYVRMWRVGSEVERHDIFTTYEGAVTFAEMMAQRDIALRAAPGEEARRG